MTTARHNLTAHQLSDAYRAKDLSPVEATRAILERIETWEPHINALYLTDADGAIAQAAASEARWREGRPLSPLDGVPITIKDIIATRGVPVPLGTAAADLTPALEDQPPAARVREAGADAGRRAHAHCAGCR